MATHASQAGRHSRRQRARKACTECRRRKRRCDGLSPCSMCTQYEYECRYGEEPLASNHHRGGTEAERELDASEQQSRPTTSDRGVATRTGQGILDPSKSRYMSQNSAVAFPNLLGVEFGSQFPPRLHSFAWNCGIRPEEPPSARTLLMELASLAECQRYSKIYFSNVHDSFNLLDQEEFLQVCDRLWTSTDRDLVLEAVVGGVIALGSYFALHKGHPREAEIAKHVKDVLEDSTISRRPSLDQIIAWVLRTLYLRSTTRPHLTWLASSIALHLAEAIGLHRDMESEILTHRIESQTGTKGSRTFWIAWSLNTMISYEYGRTRKSFDSISCDRAILEEKGGSTGQQLRMAQLIPDDQAITDPTSSVEILETSIRKLQEIEPVTGYPVLCRADICFSLYRRLRLFKLRIAKDVILSILGVGRIAVEAAYGFAQRGVPWWNLLSTTFQYFCVLLAIDSSDSLSQVSWALSKLEGIARMLDTHLAFEALETAKTLLRDSMRKKRQELAFMEIADGATMPLPAEEINLDWDALLDPLNAEIFMFGST
ncbi:Protein RDR1 [Tolypocladium ophioglossoides CBS 100239]|uniref:Protein RDR1 n=1 Tax=Tolypocladium ophioglossoides (strain CBS 100239) TaxID=1163406 RepID=A0A0L0N545_TOLOC|nr:Protein RDR1 [Tolypocladium ophioglossoides CBS 100239]